MKRASLFTRRVLLVSTCAAAAFSSALAQQEIGFIEAFALAKNREDVLKQLIPGTEEYYYFHALHYQNTRQGEELGTIMVQWHKRFPNSNLRKQIQNREALINFQDDPKASIEHIRKSLGLQFNHQQEGKAKAREFATVLDQGEVSWERFLADALRGKSNLQNLNANEFFTLLKNGHKLTGPQRRDLLSRADNPDLPKLVDLIIDDLKSKESRGFGEFNIHRALTIAQLDELRGKKDDLIRNERFVHTYLSKLRPGPDSTPAADVAVRQAYLDRAWEFVSQLEPSFNSLKAHLLYQRLLFDYAQGKLNGKRFMESVVHRDRSGVVIDA